MTDTESMIATIENDPNRFDDHVEDLRSVLESGDVEARQTVAEMLRDSAQTSPAVVARHTTLLEITLHDDDPTVRRFGAVATANVCNTTPEAVTGLVDALVDSYSTLEHGSEKISIIRSLGIIGDETNTALDQYDPWFADILRNGDGLIPAETAENIGNIVVESPQEYPEMVQALLAVLGESGHETQSHAIMAVALIAQDDVTALPDPEQALAAVTQLRTHRNIDTEKVNKAAGMIRTAVNEHETTE